MIFISFNNLEQTVFAQTAPSTQDSLQLFYQHPSYNKLIKYTEGIVNHQVTSEHVAKLMLIFTAMAIDHHPHYAKQIVDHFAKYSQQEQQLLYAALIVSGKAAFARNIEKTYHFSLQYKPEFNIKDIKQLEIKDDADQIDYLWAAFFATGANEYLLKMIQYINHDTLLLSIAQKIRNDRALCALASDSQECFEQSNTDILTRIKDAEKNQQEVMHKINVITAALWSLESNRQMDKFVDQKVNEIFKHDPTLDYSKKI